MSNSESLAEESFELDLLEYPHYTRPEDIFGLKVPGVLLEREPCHDYANGGREQSIEKTKRVSAGSIQKISY